MAVLLESIHATAAQKLRPGHGHCDFVVTPKVEELKHTLKAQVKRQGCGFTVA